MKKTKSHLSIAFYVSGKATRLRGILERKKSVDLIKSTRLVICDNTNNSDLKKYLSPYGISFEEIDYLNLKDDKRESLSELMLSLFCDHNIDYCFCYGDHILKGELLEVYEHKIINFHPSLLPFLKGRNAIDQAIKEDVMILGNTAHFLTDDVDSGPIIMQSLIHIDEFNDGGYEKVLNLQIDMNIQIFYWLSRGRIKISENGDVKVVGADYGSVSFYPKLEF